MHDSATDDQRYTDRSDDQAQPTDQNKTQIGSGESPPEQTPAADQTLAVDHAIVQHLRDSIGRGDTEFLKSKQIAQAFDEKTPTHVATTMKRLRDGDVHGLDVEQWSASTPYTWRVQREDPGSPEKRLQAVKDQIEIVSGDVTDQHAVAQLVDALAAVERAEAVLDGDLDVDGRGSA